MRFKKNKSKRIAHRVSTPFVYLMLAPIIISHISIELYQNICFRFWGISLVKRRKYIKIDRHKLKYLKWFERINCAYCGYANGLINYARAILAETEKYWCGIKHKNDSDFVEPEYHKKFIDYGDKDAYEKISKTKKSS